ncbi:hypothetical protein J6590_025516 [Homalodisca vitripennis]|nr:hypothetical protein J6590_025516 [Homalodisca vitripennis]
MGQVKANKPSLTQSGDQRLKGDFGEDCSAVSQPNSNRARRYLMHTNVLWGINHFLILVLTGR